MSELGLAIAVFGALFAPYAFWRNWIKDDVKKAQSRRTVVLSMTRAEQVEHKRALRRVRGLVGIELVPVAVVTGLAWYTVLVGGLIDSSRGRELSVGKIAIVLLALFWTAVAAWDVWYVFDASSRLKDLETAILRKDKPS